ncbi:hypothetical protein GCM10010349_74980 [Streptomyces flavofungini]|nr:hypothetical protein GCM10010349_74980 [Streptomyces flavofungini]
MAKSKHTAPGWASFVNPSEETFRLLRYGGGGATQLIEVGTAWDRVDAGWEAVIIAPLERGLHTLDALALPLDGGHPVIADHLRSELILLVDTGTVSSVLDYSVPGVRGLTAGSFLLVPRGACGAYPAAWLSRPTHRTARYAEPLQLCEAVLSADQRRTEHGLADRGTEVFATFKVARRC